MTTMQATEIAVRQVELGAARRPGILRLPPRARGLVVFAHGSGSGRLSPRNNHVAQALGEAGLATLLFDLLSPAEEAVRSNIFDIGLLAERLIEGSALLSAEPEFERLTIHLFGASTGGGAALRAAAMRPSMFASIVSRGGRPDLAGAEALRRVRAPTQLIVGSLDTQVIELNRAAARELSCEHELVIVPGAGHLFEEPRTLDAVVGHAQRWFLSHTALPASERQTWS